jgi:hypothetical protein
VLAGLAVLRGFRFDRVMQDEERQAEHPEGMLGSKFAVADVDLDWIGHRENSSAPPERGADLRFFGADDGIRTRDPHLGKVMLYQLSHVREGAQISNRATEGE